MKYFLPLFVLSILSGCAAFEKNGNAQPYQLCSGFYSSRSCVPYPSRSQCNAAIQICQREPGQDKPWLCGQCVPAPASSHDDKKEVE